MLRYSGILDNQGQKSALNEQIWILEIEKSITRYENLNKHFYKLGRQHVEGNETSLYT